MSTTNPDGAKLSRDIEHLMAREPASHGAPPVGQAGSERTVDIGNLQTVIAILALEGYRLLIPCVRDAIAFIESRTPSAPVAPERPADLACEKATWAALIEWLTEYYFDVPGTLQVITKRAIELRPQFVAPVAPAGRQDTAAGERDADAERLEGAARAHRLSASAIGRSTTLRHYHEGEADIFERIAARLRSVALPNAAVKAAHAYLDSTPESFGDAEKLRMHLAAVLKAGSVVPAAETMCEESDRAHLRAQEYGYEPGVSLDEVIDDLALQIDASQPVAVAPSARFAELAYMEPCKKGGQHSWFYRCDKCAVEVLGTEWDDKPGAALASPAPPDESDPVCVNCGADPNVAITRAPAPAAAPPCYCASDHPNGWNNACPHHGALAAPEDT